MQYRTRGAHHAPPWRPDPERAQFTLAMTALAVMLAVVLAIYVTFI